ncbi:MAG: hypothetical protein MUF42_03470 [Cytophagaceae bacterium]|jgi:hypothetical protein|nr:hypothetical protein [Cytophagaceae bacterium]
MRKKSEFKYQVPETNNQSKFTLNKHFPSPWQTYRLPEFPLPEEQYLEWQDSNATKAKRLSDLLFDSIRLESLELAAWQESALNETPLSTLLVLHQHQQVSASEKSSLRGLYISQIAYQLKLPEHRQFFLENYLIPTKYWHAEMRTLHRLLMEYPNHSAWTEMMKVRLQASSTPQIIDYCKEVQFLDRGPTDEYFHTNAHIMQPIPTEILEIILDKTNDYYWFAAYPERDIEQAIEALLEQRK